MLWRRAYQKLVDWKEKGPVTALCIIGARQTGKTTLIREFGKHADKHFVELNFLLDSGAAAIFADASDAEAILTNLTAYVQQPMEPGRTLVLLDEIQACPNARTAIKALVEDGRFDYIETGSQLGVHYRNVRSYPVGYEEIYYMYPMDLEEFCRAVGVQQETLDHLRACCNGTAILSDSVHATMKKLFQSYIVIGGMPAVVDCYVKTHDIGQVIGKQRELLELYRQDITQYAEGADKIKVRAVFDSIPAQLSDKNRRFFLSSVDPHGRNNRYESSFLWLSNAGVALPCYNVSAPQPPLQLNEKHNLFKLFMGDTGLLCASSMENIQFDLLQGKLDINSGSILENVFAQLLRANGYSLYYYDSKRIGEVDFLLQDGRSIDLLEVKSGKDYHIHASLTRMMKTDEWSFRQALVFCGGKPEELDGIRYLPWYMIMFLKPTQMPDHLIYEIDLSGLAQRPL